MGPSGGVAGALGSLAEALIGLIGALAGLAGALGYLAGPWEACLGPWEAGLERRGDGRTNVQMDGISPHSTELCPLRGPLPKKGAGSYFIMNRYLK